MSQVEEQTRNENADQAANRAAARHVFDDYRQRKAANTLRRQDAGLLLFAEYLKPCAPIYLYPHRGMGVILPIPARLRP